MVYQFRCSVCEGKFTSKGSWLRHLLEPTHSDLARQELIKNWSGEETRKRKCLIVAYSKQAVGKSDRILQFFSKDRYKGIVTDFVWWKERPGIGFIQFESRKVAKSMIGLLDDHQIVLDDQQFQFRRADKFLDLEWDQLLPFLPERMDENKDPSLEEIETKENPLKNHPEGSKQHQGGATDTFIPSNDKLNVFLKRELLYINSQVKLPRKKLSLAVRVATSLYCTLSDADKQLIPEVDDLSVALIRNWCLGLKYHEGGDLPFITVKILKKPEGQLKEYQKEFTVQKLKNIFKNADNPVLKTDYTQSYSKVKAYQILPNQNLCKTSAKSFTGIKINCSGSISKGKKQRAHFSIEFALSGNILLAVESQLWRLAKYFMLFDSRCETLLQVVYFWANLNSIQVGIAKTGVPGPGSVINLAPDPLGLTWMVFFFLYGSDQGGKILPTPSEILDRNVHQPIYFENPGSGSANPVDIGFAPPDKDFKEAWKKKNGIDSVDWSPTEIFNLVYKFFCFWDGFSEESWVINTREGKYYRSEDFLQLKVDQNDSANKHFVQLQDFQRERLENWQENGENVKHRGILHMSNPFNIFWRILLFHDALKHFKPTKDKLQGLSNQVKAGEIEIDKVNNKKFVQYLFGIEQKGK